jgi:hypothetical protein
MGGGNYVSGRTPATPELAFLLRRLVENIVFPVTGILGDGEPHADSFTSDEAGRLLLSALRDWTRDSPTTAVLGIARSIIHFVVNVIPAPTTAETPAPPWRPCATNTWSGPAPCSP